VHATHTISSREGVMSPDSPMMSALCVFAASRILAHGVITPKSITWAVKREYRTKPSPCSCCSPGRLRRCSCRCRARHPSQWQAQSEPINTSALSHQRSIRALTTTNNNRIIIITTNSKKTEKIRSTESSHDKPCRCRCQHRWRGTDQDPEPCCEPDARSP